MLLIILKWSKHWRRSVHYKSYLLLVGTLTESVPIKQQRIKKVMPDIKKCKNLMCGKLIYPHQSSWRSGYCDGECVQESIRWRPRVMNRQKRRGRYADIQTHFPHRLYPKTILVIPLSEQL